MNRFIWLVALFAGSILVGCNTEKKLAQLVYLNAGDSTGATVVQPFDPRIQAGDRISILVTALNPASAAPYNIGAPSAAATGSGSSPTAPTAASGYLVQTDGAIAFPQLGKVAVTGKTIREVTELLTQRLDTFLKDPIVVVEFSNYKINVLGEVNNPGTYNIPDGRVTVLQAVGFAGDLTITGRRDNVLVVREKNGKRQFGRLDLTNKNVFNSPFYHLQQNDLVYVELNANKAAASDQSTMRNISIITTIASVAVSLIVLITSIIR